MKRLMTLAVGSLCLAAAGTQAAMAAPAPQPRIDDCQNDPADDVRPLAEIEQMLMDFQDRVDDHRARYANNEDYDVYERLAQRPILEALSAFFGGEVYEAYAAYNNMVQSGQHDTAVIERVKNVERQMKDYADRYNLGCKRYEEFHNQYMSLLAYSRVVEELGAEIYATYNITTYPNCQQFEIKNYQEVFNQFVMRRGIVQDQLDSQKALMQAGTTEDFKEWADAQLALCNFQTSVAGCYDILTANKESLQEALETMESNASPSDADDEFHDQWSVRAAQLNAQLNANMEKLREYRDQYDAGMRNAQLYFDVLSRFQDLTDGIQRDQYQLFSVDIEAAYATGRLTKENDTLLQRYNVLKQQNDFFIGQLNQAWADVANYAEVKDGIGELKSNFTGLLLNIAEAVNKNAELFTPYANRGDEIAARLRVIGKNADEIYNSGQFLAYYDMFIAELRVLELDIDNLASDFYKAKQPTMSAYDSFLERRNAWNNDYMNFLTEVSVAKCPSGVDDSAYESLRSSTLNQLNEMLKGSYKELSNVSEQSYNQNFYNYDRTLFNLEDQLADLKEDFRTRYEALKRGSQTDGSSDSDILAAISVAADELLATAAQYQERLNVLEHYNLTPLVQLYCDMQEDIVAAQTYAESAKAKGGAYVAESEARFDLGSLSYMKDQLAERFNSFMTKWEVLSQNASLQAEIATKVRDARSTVDKYYWDVVNYQIPEGVDSTQPFEELKQQYSASIRQQYEMLADCVNTIDSNMLTRLGLQSMSDSADAALAQTEALMKRFEDAWKQTLQSNASSDLLNFLDLRDKVNGEISYIASKLKPLYEKIDMENDPDKRAALQTLQGRYNTIYQLLSDMQSQLELARQDARYTEAYHAQQTANYEDLVAQVKQAEASCQAALDGYGTTVDADRLPALLELDRVMMAEVQQGSETLSQSRVPESLSGTKVGANLEEYASTALAGYKELVSALAAEVDYNVRVIVAFGGISQETYDEYVAQIYSIKAQAEDYVRKFAETWAVLCEKGQQLVATQADLDALEIEINVAIAELEQRLAELGGNSQRKAPARIDGTAMSGEREAIESALASYYSLREKVQQAKEQLNDVEYTLYDPERVDASAFAPVPALVAEVRQSREQFRQIREIYKYNMEEAGADMNFDINVFYATRKALRNDIDRFILFLNDNLPDGENFSDHHVMQKAKGTPFDELFWLMNNDAQREYVPRYCDAAVEIIMESNGLSNAELALRADEFLSRLYTIKAAAKAYEDEWWNRFYNYSEDIYMYHDYSVRMNGFNEKLDAAEAYFNNLVVSGDNADELNKIVADYKARLNDIRNQAEEIAKGIYRPASFEEFDAACEALWSLECANLEAPVVESVIDVLLRDFRGTYANMSRGELPQIDLDAFFDNLNSVADDIDHFVYMLNNEYYVPEGIEGSYIYIRLWEFNNGVQDEYVERFRDPSLEIIRTARSFEREGKLAGLYEQAPLFMQQILDIKTQADNYVNDPYGYNYQYQQMLAEAYDYLALKQGIAELREECQKTQAEMQAYLADVTGVGADARQQLESCVDDGVKGMAAMLEQLAELELEVLNMEDCQMLEHYKNELQGLRVELYKRREGFLNGWREVTGSLPGQVGAALYAEFVDNYYKATELDLVCQTNIEATKAMLAECPSAALNAQLAEAAALNYDPAHAALFPLIAQASVAQAEGTFGTDYVDRLNHILEQFNRVIATCDGIAALMKQYQATLADCDALITEATDTFNEMLEIAKKDPESEFVFNLGPIGSEISLIQGATITLKEGLRHQWADAGNLQTGVAKCQRELAANRARYEELLAQYKALKDNQQYQDTSFEAFLDRWDEVAARLDAARESCLSEENEKLYNADGLNRCETYEAIREEFTMVFSELRLQLLMLRDEMWDSNNAGTFILDVDGFKARLQKADTAIAEAIERFNQTMAEQADALEAERRLRYGIVDKLVFDSAKFQDYTHVANAGSTVDMPLYVNNSVAVGSFSFNLEVPRGLVRSGVDISKRISVRTRGTRAAAYNVATSVSSDQQTIAVTCTPYMGSTVKAGEGAVAVVEIQDVAVGDYPVIISEAKFVTINGETVAYDKVYDNLRAVDVETYGEAESETAAEVVQNFTSEITTFEIYEGGYVYDDNDDPSQRVDSRRRAAAAPSESVDERKALLAKYDVNGDGRITIGDLTTYIRLIGEKSKK